MTADDKQRAEGRAVRARIMGDDWVSSAGQSPGLAAFTERAIDQVWATAWTAPSLELRLKSVTTISVLAALGHLDELRAHAAGALRAGLLDAAELRALILHALPYVGFPAARQAMVVVDEVVQAAGATG
jgi:alkylhydroperoxidase/carboxymuconolactone decarboxylase family protein YurZ